MVYERVYIAVSEWMYPTANEDETLMKIRTNEVLRLSDRDESLNSAFGELWRKNIESSHVKEKVIVLGFLMENVDIFKKVRYKAKNLIQRLEDDSLRARTLDDIRWYDEQIARLNRGAEYLKGEFLS